MPQGPGGPKQPGYLAFAGSIPDALSERAGRLPAAPLVRRGLCTATAKRQRSRPTISRPGQATTITGIFIGYLPAARVAEFQYEIAGATIGAIVEPAKQYAEPSKHPSIEMPSRHRTKNARRTGRPGQAIHDFRVIKPTPKPLSHREGSVTFCRVVDQRKALENPSFTIPAPFPKLPPSPPRTPRR